MSPTEHRPICKICNRAEPYHKSTCPNHGSGASACSARRVTWDNLQEIANWCGAADLYDTRVLLLISSPNGEQMAQVGDTITKYPDGTFSVQNDQTDAPKGCVQ